MRLFRFIPVGTKNPKVILHWLVRDFRLRKKRKMLRNHNFSIICNNCIGAMVTHDFYQPTLSPTVNLFMYPDDYIAMLKEFPNSFYSEVQLENSNLTYPVGNIDGRKIHFLHYKDFESAKEAWVKRANRIDIENCLFILVERDGCTFENLIQFDNLPLKNKVALVHKQYPEIKCAVVVPGFDDREDVDAITRWGGDLAYVNMMSLTGLTS